MFLSNTAKKTQELLYKMYVKALIEDTVIHTKPTHLIHLICLMIYNFRI